MLQLFEHGVPFKYSLRIMLCWCGSEDLKAPKLPSRKLGTFYKARIYGFHHKIMVVKLCYWVWFKSSKVFHVGELQTTMSGLACLSGQLAASHCVLDLSPVRCAGAVDFYGRWNCPSFHRNTGERSVETVNGHVSESKDSLGCAHGGFEIWATRLLSGRGLVEGYIIQEWVYRR